MNFIATTYLYSETKILKWKLKHFLFKISERKTENNHDVAYKQASLALKKIFHQWSLKYKFRTKITRIEVSYLFAFSKSEFPFEWNLSQFNISYAILYISIQNIFICGIKRIYPLLISVILDELSTHCHFKNIILHIMQWVFTLNLPLCNNFHVYSYNS